VPLKVLGDHPELGGEIQVLAGRYGPYVKHGKVNATIPKDLDPASITMEEAIKLIAARATANGSGGKAAPKSKAKAKPAAANGEKKTAPKAKAKPKAATKPKGKSKSATPTPGTSA
jgi:DNA topoisomerase-1